MNKYNNKKGQAIIVILMICLVLGILVGAVLNLQRGQINLLSRSAKDFLALSTAEAGLNCVLAEMKADYQFVTHGNPYIPMKGWASPAPHKYLIVQNNKYLDVSSNGRGTYKGKLKFPTTKLNGDFKVRIKLIGSKNSKASKTVDEAHRYFQLEAIGKIEDVYRKITTIVEKAIPANYLFYDGQFLDLGEYGPFRVIPGEMSTGRLYGHEMIMLSKRGPFDRGADLLDMEKISTPGYIRSYSSTRVKFANGGGSGAIKPGNDSTQPDKFNSFPQKKSGKIVDNLVLDGYHGAKSNRLPPVNPDYYKNATDPKPKILNASTKYKGFKKSRWKNPSKPGEEVYDLFFGWDYKKKDEKVLLYSTVPLRIWGCPPYKRMTIFSEKDVYIAGDFNANRANPQNYSAGYKHYKNTPRNGTDKNGAMIISMGRIWFDYSNPMLFLRNEFETLIDYELAIALGGKDPKNRPSEMALATTVYPPRFKTSARDIRMPLTSGKFKAIQALFLLPKQTPEAFALSALRAAKHPEMKKVREYLKPSVKPEEYKNRFCINSMDARTKINASIVLKAFTVGILTKGARDRIIRSILDAAEKEIEEDKPSMFLGPWNAADRLFKLALKHPASRFKIPEMTVNALLIDSAELNARWALGNKTTKVRNEIGNIHHPLTKSFPFMNKGTRMILRHMGSMIHLRNRKIKPFLNGSLRNDQSILRRNIYDTTFVRGGGDYFPPYPMAGFSIISWKDEISTKKEYNNW